jgi:hypothetical protein
MDRMRRDFAVSATRLLGKAGRARGDLKWVCRQINLDMHDCFAFTFKYF